MKLNTILLSSTLLLFLAACGKAPQGTGSNEVTTGSIVGGKKVKDGQLMSVVALTRDGRSFCTGNLVNNKTIYTAAHCVQSMQFMDLKSFTAYAKEIQVVLNVLFTDEQQEAASPAELQRMLADSIKAHYNYKASSIKFYFGSGKVGGEFSGRSLKIAKVEIADEYTEYLSGVLQGTNSPVDITGLPTIHDKAVITLEEDITDVAPVPLATESEINDLKAGDKVYLSGFGLKFDARVIMRLSGQLKAINKKIMLETDLEQAKLLQAQFVEIRDDLLPMIEVYKLSGDKHLTVAQIDVRGDTFIKLKPSVEGTLSGSCSGDSGGPAFIINSQNQLRQIGTTSAGEICGLDTLIAPIH